MTARLTSRTAAAGAALLLGAGLAGCGDSAQENESQACQAAAAYDAAVSNLVDLFGTDPTVGEVQEAREQLDAARVSLDDAVDDVASDRVDIVSDAWDAFSEAIGEIDDDMTLSGASQVLQEQSQQLADTVESAGEALDC